MTTLSGPGPGHPADLREKIARRCRSQARGCAELGSPLYGYLLERVADEIERGGQVWELLRRRASEPGGSMLALRLMGATHRLALDGTAPGLAAHYPSTGGDGNPIAAWGEWAATIRNHTDAVDALIDRPVQTNEVGRAAALLGGFLHVARATQLPLRLLEVGTSAGLNLRWDRFRYEAGAQRWGPANSPVVLDDVFARGGGAAPRLDPESVVIAARAGCDLAPVDSATEDGQLTLLSFVWPDQTARLDALRGACRIAGAEPAEVVRAGADAWLAERLGRSAPGAATVVFHSVMLQYVAPDARARMLQVIETAGQRATPDAPLAWLRLEPEDRIDNDMEVRLTTWPGGDDRRLAYAHPHGAWVRWLGA